MQAVDQLFSRAFSLHQDGRLVEAEGLYQQTLRLKSDAPKILYFHGAVLFQLQRFPEALQAAEAALALVPTAAEVLVLHGALLRGLGRPAEALASLTRATDAAPGRVDAWYNKGLILVELDQAAEAVAAFDRALGLNPDSTDVLAARAGALACLHQFDAAAMDFQAALRVAPTRADIWFKYAVTLIAPQRFDEALDALDRTLALDPDYPGAQIKRGEVLCEAGRIAEGMEQIAGWAQRAHAGRAMDEPVRAPEAKQRHDAEQREWLAARGVSVIRGLHIDGGDRTVGPAVNPANQASVAGQWAASDPKLVVIDQLLTPAALEGLRRFCLGSTVWRRSYRQGYLGAFPEHGFACPLLAQIAEELRDVFPTVLGGHGLLVSWAFKYDSRLGGILTHADPAAVNVNFWITPEEANLDAESGGMVVWDAVPPAEWEFRRANGDSESIKAFLQQAGARATTVPYRQNRAVVFDSNLFHKTDRITFREGYENRRINVTMLYGRRNFLNF